MIVGDGWGLFLARAVVVRLFAPRAHFAATILTPKCTVVVSAQMRLCFVALCTVKALVTLFTKKFHVNPTANGLLQVRREQSEQCQGVLTG